MAISSDDVENAVLRPINAALIPLAVAFVLNLGYELVSALA